VPDTSASLPWPSRSVLALGRAASRLSRAAGRGRGSQVGGKLAYRIRPQTLSDLAAGRHTALVSATNGKSTTAALLAAAVRTLGPTAFNATGANMEEGLVVALDADRAAPHAVLETDEAYVGIVAEATRPRVVVLMNLSRDFLERGVRAKRLAAHWRDTVVALDEGCTVVADADDPLVAWAVRGAPRVTWVAGEDTWNADSMVCRDCLVGLERDAGHWRCPHCGLARPQPDWWLTEGSGAEPVAHGPDDVAVTLPRSLPGHAARVNALFALAGAAAMGVAPRVAAERIAEVENVDGRYARHRYGGHVVRVLLAKNPASWTEALSTVEEDRTTSLVLAMASRGTGGGQDTAMLWDAPFERLAGRTVTTAGSRGDELALRLATAGVDVSRGGADVVAAIAAQPPGQVDVIANWPAFNDVVDRIGRRA
jgi:lipid II isoglutaminyl synthase (glutamine-hydrolysing)